MTKYSSMDQQYGRVYLMLSTTLVTISGIYVSNIGCLFSKAWNTIRMPANSFTNVSAFLSRIYSSIWNIVCSSIWNCFNVRNRPFHAWCHINSDESFVNYNIDANFIWFLLNQLTSSWKCWPDKNHRRWSFFQYQFWQGGCYHRIVVLQAFRVYGSVDVPKAQTDAVTNSL